LRGFDLTLGNELDRPDLLRWLGKVDDLLVGVLPRFDGAYWCHVGYSRSRGNVLEDEGWRILMRDEQYKFFGGE
jgi:hypothetical protein